METKEYAPGDIIIQEGSIGNEMFIIKKGKIRVFKKINQEKVDLTILKDGDFLGEMSLFLDIPRSASAEALENMKIQKLRYTISLTS